ncbi:MAG: Ig-like domain-containing protein [Oscillospiraceae bacterium]|nr:Ig-like domain-containing protein [Oscillospiraceae bacterium]
MKKSIAFILALILLVSAFLVSCTANEHTPVPPVLVDHAPLAGQRAFAPASAPVSIRHTAAPLSVHEAVFGANPRDGYILAPTIVGRQGVDIISTFVLQTPADYGASMPSVTIDGQAPPHIAREDGTTFLVTPAIPLTPNSVYVFRLDSGDDADITWAFQTAPHFEISTTLPRNESTNVPVCTGIEVEFSFGMNINIADYFSIYPHVEGRFIHRDSTAIFMPTDPLEEGQIYAVTIRAGISAPDSEEIIAADHVFSFETESAEESSQTGTARVHFSNQVVEFPSFAPPRVNYWFNYDIAGNRPSISIQVHRIANRDRGIAAVNQLTDIPSWSHRFHADQVVDTSGLTRVYNAAITRRQAEDGWGEETYTLSSPLAPGFYVLTASVGDARSQVIIQITDLAVQIVADNDRALLWINDMTNGLPAAGAMVYDPIDNSTAETGAYGIAVAERGLSFGEHLIITAHDGKESVIFANASFRGGWDSWAWDGWGRGWAAQTANSHYWTALQLDRTLFQRSDTVSLWGFVQNRHQYESISYVTAILTEHTWWHAPERDTLHRQNIPVANSAYSGEIRLPHLEPGSYELAIYHGDILLSSTFFTVMDYVTPPYRLSISASKDAIFAGEEVTFTAETAFFEGTPVPDLNISYHLWSWGLTAGEHGTDRTNAEGIIELSVRPYAEDASVHGEQHLSFSAEATLPEIGWTHERADVRVFVNDIDVRPEATRSGGDASLSIDVHQIDLDRINDGTANGWGDFLGEPIAGQEISVELLEIYWEPIREGERYDHITRQVVPRYRHERRERSLERFTMTTDEDGNAAREFQVPDRDRASYQARLTTTDGNGREIVQDVFIGRDWSWFHWNAEDNALFLDGVNEDGYDIGDEVELTVMRGTEPVTQGNFLFVTVQNGILSYHIGQNPLTFTFDEIHVPNVQVYAYHFNGHTYQAGRQMSRRLRFAATDRNLEITVSAEEDSYRPGDMVRLTVTTADADGNPKPANVNISLVDEALFALMDYTIDTFAMLYGNVSDSLRFSAASHRTFESDGIEEDGWAFRGLGGGGGMTFSVMATPEMAAESAVDFDDGATYGGSGGEAHIRARFEDTAIFRSLRTDENGVASFEFQLPDNITAWRVTASAISEDLYAGNALQNLQVTQPMFLHYTLNSTFLVGDRPYIGVNAYGTSLSGGEQVLFEVWREDAPTDIRRAQGVSFERVNIPLWEMTAEGFGALVIRATVGGYSDAVRHTYQVVSSHRQVDTAVFYEVSPDTVFDVTSEGLTNITFMDLGRGQFLNDLIGMRHIWRNGARIEGLVAKREATALIQAHFPDTDLFGQAGTFDVREYQTDSGGIAILPYAEADLQTTVMLIPFIQDDVNLPALRDYLRDIADNSVTDNRMLALYGLALLGEPVLLELQQYAMLSDLSVRDAAYVGLGLAALGETHAARDLFNRRIAPHVQAVAPYYRVEVGGSRRDILDATSIAALLAAQLGVSESMGLHNYAARNRAATPLMTIEHLAFISHEIENHTDTAASITYTLFGETVTRDLGHGGQFTLRIPAQNMGEFNLTAVSGEVGAVSIVRTPLGGLYLRDSESIVRREFFRAGTTVSTNTFDQGDLVRVQITIDYSAMAVSGSYVITDFLPAGLVHVSNSARFGDRSDTAGWWAHAAAEGPRITFFDFNGRHTRTRTYYFYARAINPGTFLAEGTIVQSLGAREHFMVGEDAVVVIEAG